MTLKTEKSHLCLIYFQVIFSFQNSRYGKCLKLLEDMKENLFLDMYLAAHVNKLFGLIRNRGLVQYFR